LDKESFSFYGWELVELYLFSPLPSSLGQGERFLLWLGISGAMPVLPLYVFMARKNTALFYSRSRVVCLDTSECGSKIPGKLWNMVLEKGGGEVDRSCEK